MKKILCVSAAIAYITFLGFANVAANDTQMNGYKQSSTCPNLSEKAVDPDFRDGMIVGLQSSMPTIWKVYEDALKNYNHTDEIKDYVTENSLQELGVTLTFGNVLQLLYVQMSADSNEKKILDAEYQRLMSLIKPENKNWCNELISQESLDTIEKIRTKLSLSKKD